jgi:hypothetical protein
MRLTSRRTVDGKRWAARELGGQGLAAQSALFSARPRSCRLPFRDSAADRMR